MIKYENECCDCATESYPCLGSACPNRNVKHLYCDECDDDCEELYNYGSAVRKVMYTTNAIEAINSSFRKVTKKGSFPSEDAVMKALYLRITELYKKWNGRPISNWAMVRNQLSTDEKIQARIMKYENY